MLNGSGFVCKRASNTGRARTEHGSAIRRIALIAMAALVLLPVRASPGNISLTMSGIASPIDVYAFSFGASKQWDLTNTAYPTRFNDLSVTLAESAVTPIFWVNAAGGGSIASAVLTVRSPVSARPISDWTFTNGQLTSVIASSSANAAALSTFTLSFPAGTVTYRVYATDGSVAQQTCWNAATGAAC